MNNLIFRHHFPLAVDKHPVSLALLGDVIHQMPGHTKKHPAARKHRCRHGRGISFRGPVSVEVLHKHCIDIRDRIASRQRLGSDRGSECPVRISRLNEDKAINGVIFPCDGVPDFPVENQPIISTVHLPDFIGVYCPGDAYLAGGNISCNTIVTSDNPNPGEFLSDDPVYGIS